MQGHENSKDVMCIWDQNQVPEVRDGALIYSWNGYKGSSDVEYILDYVEEHADRLRDKYLAFIHDLGEIKVSGESVIDHLILGNGLSYWWLSLFVEKSLYKSPITDSIRLLALEEIIIINRPSTLRLVSSNVILKNIIRDLCSSLDITFEYKRPPRVLFDNRSWVRKFYAIMPEVLKAIIFLGRYLSQHWPLRNARPQDWHAGHNTVFFSSYFFGIDIEKAHNGDFDAHYWQQLLDLTRELGLRENWLQNFEASPTIPNAQRAIDLLGKINTVSAKFSAHKFVQSHLSWKIIIRVLRNWIKLISKSYSLDIKGSFIPAGMSVSLWPLLKNNWSLTMYGYVSIINLVWIELFDDVLKNMPYQAKGFFLCENQAWERAFIYAWRKHGHGQLVGVAHSTVRFWDLRYFTDQRSRNRLGQGEMPNADLIALNGNAAISSYLNAGYKRELFVECEALRYGFLSKLKCTIQEEARSDNTIKVLILGDYVSKSTEKMLELLEAATSSVTKDMTYTIKPHPASTVEAEDYPGLGLDVATKPLGEILYEYDLVYSSNMTSASVDAYCSGLPVIIVLDTQTLNYSPLRGHNNVTFISTPDDLAEALLSFDRRAAADKPGDEFFFLDPDLARWRALLKVQA
jgi:surface carbohydrate biosynthesis protein (TIGR04326 family)